MSGRRIVLAVAALAVLVLAPVSRPAALVVDAAGVIAAAETGYTLTITNRGTEPIKCFALDPLGRAAITGGSGPSGWGVAAQSGRLGGIDATGRGIAPGGSATFSFATAAPYPAGAGGDLYVSSTCTPGSDVKRTATGPNPRTVSPPPPPGGTPPPPPAGDDRPECTCKNITAKVTRTALNFTDERRWHFQLQTQIECTGGGARTCVGHVEVETPKGYKVTTKLPKTGRFACVGKCGKRNAPQFLFVGGPHPADMNTIAERRNKTLVFRFHRSCGTLLGADHEELGVTTLKVVYDGRGIPDQRKSDFNANGVPDGREAA